jgi:hypothetical protein
MQLSGISLIATDLSRQNCALCTDTAIINICGNARDMMRLSIG